MSEQTACHPRRRAAWRALFWLTLCCDFTYGGEPAAGPAGRLLRRCGSRRALQLPPLRRISRQNKHFRLGIRNGRPARRPRPVPIGNMRKSFYERLLCPIARIGVAASQHAAPLLIPLRHRRFGSHPPRDRGPRVAARQRFPLRPSRRFPTSGRVSPEREPPRPHTGRRGARRPRLQEGRRRACKPFGFAQGRLCTRNPVGGMSPSREPRGVGTRRLHTREDAGQGLP